jgi:hypothetical protein
MCHSTAPIDIVVTDWEPEVLDGVAADGRTVKLKIVPTRKSKADLNIDILFDRSGSMAQHGGGEPDLGSSKFKDAQAGLIAAASRLQPKDRIRLWEFEHDANFVGKGCGPASAALVSGIRAPDGGTDIAAALETVVRSRPPRDVLIVTDGKSWALDTPAFTRSGLRLHAVLIGEDSLEAGVAHLASMTGGQVFIAAGGSAAAIAAALDAARAPFGRSRPIDGKLTSLEVFRRGAHITATWGAKRGSRSSIAARRVGATAAALAMPLMEEDAAALLAVTEGLVSRLTSLVMVDEAGACSPGLPGRRTVSLPQPVGAAPPRELMCVAPFDMDPDDSALEGFLARLEPAPPRAAPVLLDDLRSIACLIDWDHDPDALRRGDLSPLPGAAARAVRSAARIPRIVEVAAAQGIDPVVVVIALLARAAIEWSRSAKRLSETILRSAQSSPIAALAAEIGL